MRAIGLCGLILVSACTSDDDDGQGPFCGDGVCTVGESNQTCSADCPASGPFCGDGACNGTETSASCSADCASSACSPGDAATCAGETICLNGQCVAAFGRAYRINAYSIVVPQFMPDGSTWDAAGGAPDPYAVITLNGTALGMTTAAQDIFNPVWNMATNPTNVPAGSTLIVDAYDEDIADDDPILRCQFAPLVADVLHVGEGVCTGALGTLTVRFSTN